MVTTRTETAGDEGTTARESPVVRFREVGKVYDDEGLRVTAIRSVTFDIPKKRFAMIVGPSGSGKTTLLNLIGCIDTPTSGRLEVCGRDIGTLGDRALTDFRSRRIAFVSPGTLYLRISRPSPFRFAPGRSWRAPSSGLVSSTCSRSKSSCTRLSTSSPM